MTSWLTDWDTASFTQRKRWIDICHEQGHDLYYVEGTDYRWDCARCNWSEHRMRPTLPPLPSMPHPRFQIIDTWRSE